MSGLVESPSERRRADLASFSRWVLLPLTLYGFKECREWSLSGNWRSLAFGCALLLQVCNHLAGLWMLRKGLFAVPLRAACWGILALYGVASLHAQGDPVSAVIPVMGVALALPHLERLEFRIYTVAASAALLLSLAAMLFWPMAPSGGPTAQALARLLSTSAGVGTTLLLMWQIKNNLTLGSQRRAAAEQEELSAEERYRLIIDNAREGICVLDRQGAVLVQNSRMGELLVMDSGGIRDMLFKRCITGESLSHEFQVPGPGLARWVLVNAHPLRESSGEISGALALATDITELKRMQESLALAQGREAEGRLAGGIAHDMNNVLAVINGACELLAGQIPPGDAASLEALESIRRPAAEATAVVRQLLAFRRAPGDAGFAPGQEGGHERILLVDDDADVRSVTARMLKLLGYEVLEAGSGAEAWAIYELAGADLLLTDILMPNMTGTALAGKLRESHPDLAVLFSSGYAGEEMAGQDSPLPRSLFIAKPYSAAQLGTKVRETLDMARLWRRP
jgi:CheY-like chemotaxis protein